MHNVAIVLAALLSLAFFSADHAAGEEAATGRDYQTVVAASSKPLIAESSYRLWVPDDTPVIRSLFVINMRGAGRRLFVDPEWRAMADRNSAAMLYCEFEAKSVRDNGYGLSILKACEQFAETLNRPELRHAPFVLWGHSMGGRVAQDFVRFKPARVIAFHIALRANPTSKELMEEEAAAVKVPGLYLMGANDGKPADIREHFREARRNGSPRAWVWLPGQSHWPKGMHFEKDETSVIDWRAWAAHDIVIQWTEAMIKLRLPMNVDPRKGSVDLLPVDLTKGWVADVASKEHGPVSKLDAIDSAKSWLPNEKVTQAWASDSISESD
ncbi:MAG: alpha/beta hydrolase [Rhodopirellula sp.]|jgi:pimeloyl-ACP methyl ester carboxylesterase|uniref:Putative secreted protein n=2 Tax=Rhodopirellula TaxID=265488 RepID=M5SBJ6_9BACT|nr:MULTISPECIES: alpha/beta hydrolase [Rhodopirellula]EMI28850.1 putative secreted protein [Rhodopirellula europaea SH398]MAP08084.1 alpha/beta hydrolase [Rhodopirellula sp.]